MYGKYYIELNTNQNLIHLTTVSEDISTMFHVDPVSSFRKEMYEFEGCDFLCTWSVDALCGETCNISFGISSSLNALASWPSRQFLSCFPDWLSKLFSTHQRSGYQHLTRQLLFLSSGSVGYVLLKFLSINWRIHFVYPQSNHKIQYWEGVKYRF
jgi:hypothetical protein